MADTTPLQMRVAEAMRRDIGKHRARMGPDAMDFLSVAPGDIVRITGGRSSCAIVWPADEDEKTPGIIRIDGQTRTNMGVSINDAVDVIKTRAKIARSAVLVPVNDSVTGGQRVYKLCKKPAVRHSLDTGR